MIRLAGKWAMYLYRMTSIHAEFWSKVFQQRQRDSVWWSGWPRNLRGYFLHRFGHTYTRKIRETDRQLIAEERKIGDQRVLFEDKATLLRVIAESLDPARHPQILVPIPAISTEPWTLTHLSETVKSQYSPIVRFDGLTPTLTFPGSPFFESHETFLFPLPPDAIRAQEVPEIHCVLSSIDRTGSFSVLAHSMYNETAEEGMWVAPGQTDAVRTALSIQFTYPEDASHWKEADESLIISSAVEQLARALPAFPVIQWTLWQIDSSFVALLNADTRIDASRFPGAPGAKKIYATRQEAERELRSSK